MYGIDISEHNGNINLAPYRGQFVIIRVGYGLSHIDKKFVRNVNECIRLGIPFGFYWYSYALNVADARKEAEVFLKAIAPYKKQVKAGVWFDMEDADGYKKRHGFAFTRAVVSNICNAFCVPVEAAGYYTGIYASRSWFGSLIDCPRFDKWVASWGNNDGRMHGDVSALGTMFQYTSKPLDKDYIYCDLSRYDMNKPATYDGVFPSKIPARGWFKIGDGSERLTSYRPQIKRVQNFLNWALGINLVIDGLYGERTKAACLKFQRKAGMKGTRGNWGTKTQALAEKFKK